MGATSTSRPDGRLRNATLKQREVFSVPRKYRTIHVPITLTPKQFHRDNDYLNNLFKSTRKTRVDRGRVGEKESEFSKTPRRRHSRSLSPEYRPSRHRSSRSSSPNLRYRAPKKDVYFDYDSRDLEYHSESDSGSESGDWEDYDLDDDYDERDYPGPGRYRPKLRFDEAEYLNRMLAKFRLRKRQHRIVFESRRDPPPRNDRSRLQNTYISYKRPTNSAVHVESASNFRTSRIRKSTSSALSARQRDSDINQSLHKARHSTSSSSRAQTVTPQSRPSSKGLSVDSNKDAPASIPTGPRIHPQRAALFPAMTQLRQAVKIRSYPRRPQGPSLHVHRWLSDRYAKPTKFFHGPVPKSEGILPSYIPDPKDSNKFLNVPRPRYPQASRKGDYYRGAAYGDWLESRKEWLESHNLNYPDRWTATDERSEETDEKSGCLTTPVDIQDSIHSNSVNQTANMGTWREASNYPGSICETEDHMAIDTDADSIFAPQINDPLVDLMSEQLAATTTHTDEVVLFEPSIYHPQLPMIVKTPQPSHPPPPPQDSFSIFSIPNLTARRAPLMGHRHQILNAGVNGFLNEPMSTRAPTPPPPPSPPPQPNTTVQSVGMTVFMDNGNINKNNNHSMTMDLNVPFTPTTPQLIELTPSPQPRVSGIETTFTQAELGVIGGDEADCAYTISQAEWDEEWEKEWLYNI